MDDMRKHCEEEIFGYILEQTQSNMRVEQLWDEGLNAEEIAERLGLKKKTIQDKLSNLGLTDPKITKNYMSKIWPEWEGCCRRIRGC